MDEHQLREKLTRMVEAQEEFKLKVLERVEKGRKQSRERASREEIPQFTIGNHVLMAHVRRIRSSPKPISKWTGP